MPEVEPVLSFSDVQYRFNDGTLGLDGVTIDFFPRELLILAGANGAGKTLLMRHANGLLHPTSGEVVFKGAPLRKNLRGARRSLGMVFQHPEDQFIEDSVRSEIRFGIDNLGLPAEVCDLRVQTVLEQFDLDNLKNRHPLSLSGGERRRLALASVIVMNPDYLILDEPFMELDYPGIRELLSILISLHKDGQGMCIVTHDVGKILAHSDRLILMKKGKIICAGPSRDLIGILEENGVRNPCRGGFPFEAATWL